MSPSSGSTLNRSLLEPGVSHNLARNRRKAIRSVDYTLALDIPADSRDSISGHIKIRIQVDFAVNGIALDFAPVHSLDDAGNRSAVKRLSLNGQETDCRSVNGHIVLPVEDHFTGPADIEIDFVAGEQALTRRQDLLYSLFVPDRAHTCFPCFDQPDLKAHFELALTLPGNWSAVGNGRLMQNQEARDRRRIWHFEKTEPLATYLLAFAAGEFHLIQSSKASTDLRLIGCADSAEQMRQQQGALFAIHSAALRSLERYTAQAYAYDKLDIVLVPEFQFRGMEHPGAIFYRESDLLLNGSTAPDQQLRRAQLIAHEVAHMWFGNLVTIRWFDEVWLKEVLANFMADRIVTEQFAELDHDLLFYATHYPPAQAVDRSGGSHPIRQALANLSEAADLYGPIIYQKSPIALRDLETMLGPAAFREAVCDYVAMFRHANADWADLAAIFESRGDLQLAAWADRWLDGSGRPSLELDAAVRDLGGATLSSHSGSLCVRDRHQPPYAEIRLQANEASLLLEQIPNITDQLSLAFVWHTLWEQVLNRGLDGSLLLDASVALLADDLNAVTRSLILDRLPALHWLFTESDAPRLSCLESVLFGALESRPAGDSRKPIFDALIKIVSSSAGLERLASLHTAAANCDDARDRGRIALTLALRGRDAGILAAELQRVTRAADKAWLECLAPTVDPDPDERQRAFARICSQIGELPEPWLIDAITLLHDPCRAAESVSLIRPALDMLPGLRAVGGIFLPQRWANGLLSGHGSPAAAEAVRAFLAASDKPGAIERITLQAADLLFRAAARHR